MKKIRLSLFAVLTLFLASCKKDILTSTENKDVQIISNFIKNKITEDEFKQIDWNKFKIQKLNKDSSIYSFNFFDKKLKIMSALKIKNNYLVQINDYEIGSFEIKIKHRNLNTGLVLSKQKEINQNQQIQSINFNSSVGNPITLPMVVVYSYHHSNTNNFLTVIFNQIYQNNNPSNPNPHGSGIYESIGEGYTGNTDGLIGPSEDYLEFQSVEEAVEFFTWMSTINPAEAALVAQYPVQGLQVFRNAKIALTAAQNWASNHPGSSNSPNDGRADAIRHAFWQALNTSDMGPGLAHLFAIAHETSPIPPGVSSSLFALMTQMDTHNNNVGIALATSQSWGVFTSSSTIWSYFENGYNNGNLFNLKYICKETNPYTIIYLYEPCP